jgi:hypothetical protein
LGKLQQINGTYPVAPLQLTDSLVLENYDQDNFGFLRLEIDSNQIRGIYTSAPYAEELQPVSKVWDQWAIPLRPVTPTAA